MDVLRLLWLGILLMSVSLSTATTLGAPFVLGAPQPWATRIGSSRAAVIAVPTPEESAVWRVETRLHDTTNAVCVGEMIRPIPAPPSGTEIALLIACSDRTLESVPLSPDSRAYLAELPPSDAPVSERIAYAVAHWNHEDSAIAQDAFATIGAFSAKQLSQHGNLFSRAELANLIENPRTPSDQVGFFAYLLGLSGTAEDAPVIRQRLESELEGLASGVPGLVAGYLLLTGSEGLAELEGNFLLAGRGSPFVVAAFFEALQTIAREHPDRFSSERFYEAASCGLNRDDSADLAIGFLAHQRAWHMLPRVAERLNSRDPDMDRRRAVQIAAVRFLIECQRDTDAAPAERDRAQRWLQQLARIDGDLIRRAQRISGPVQLAE